MTNTERARLLRAAASAWEHGRYNTGRKKLRQAVESYVLVTISGGVADLTINQSLGDVDILDFDNLESTDANDLRLSDREWDYLKEHHPDEFEFFRPSFLKRND